MKKATTTTTIKTSCYRNPTSIEITIDHYFQDLLQGTFHEFFFFNPLLTICRFVSHLKSLLCYLKWRLPNPVWRSYCFYNCHHRGKLFLFYYQAIVCKSFIKLILSSSPTLNFHRFRYSLSFYKDANFSEIDWIRRSWGATTSISAQLWLVQFKKCVSFISQTIVG